MEVFSKRMASFESRCDHSPDSGQGVVKGNDAGGFLGHAFKGNEGKLLFFLPFQARVWTSWCEIGRSSWFMG